MWLGPLSVLRLSLLTDLVLPSQEEEFLKRYIEYCRQSCSPRLTDQAAQTLASEYVELRAEVSALLILSGVMHHVVRGVMHVGNEGRGLWLQSCGQRFGIYGRSSGSWSGR